jgi:hypothetical protein
MTGKEQNRASTLAEFGDLMSKIFVPEEVGSAPPHTTLKQPI